MLLFHAACWQQNPHDSLSTTGHAYHWQAVNTEFDLTASTAGKQNQQKENKLYCSLSLNYITKTEQSYLFCLNYYYSNLDFEKQKNP